MKALSAVLILAFVVGTALPAAADIVEVTTSVSMPAPASDEDVKDAIRTAAREALNDLGSLKPVMMAVTAAYLSAGRLYIRFVIADEAGARLLGRWGEGAGGQESDRAEGLHRFPI